MTDLDFGLYPSTDLANGTVLARVKVTLLTAASVGDVICRLYYSASESTTEDKAGTVSAYSLFMPLEQDPSGSAPQLFPKNVYEEDNEDEEDIGGDEDYTGDGEDE